MDDHERSKSQTFETLVQELSQLGI